MVAASWSNAERMAFNIGFTAASMQRSATTSELDRLLLRGQMTYHQGKQSRSAEPEHSASLHEELVPPENNRSQHGVAQTPRSYRRQALHCPATGMSGHPPKRYCSTGAHHEAALLALPRIGKLRIFRLCDLALATG